MRTKMERIGLVLSVVAVCLFTSAAMGQVYTDPVGFVKVDAVKNGLTMISVPLDAADKRLNGDPGCIGDMIKENLVGGAGGGTADLIWKWDAAVQEYKTSFLIADWGAPYDGKWWDDASGDYSLILFEAGDACWIQRRDTGDPVETITFLGWVPMEGTTTVTFVQGLSMFNWPYPTTLKLNDSTIGTVGTGGSGGGTADVVWQWNAPAQTYTTAFLIAGWGAPYDGKWWDDATADYSLMSFEPGRGFWYMRRPANPASWVCIKPY